MNQIGNKINGWTRDKQCQQIFYFIETLVLLGLYSGLVFPPILSWSDNIMIALSILTYALFLTVFIIYLILTCKDPVDNETTQNDYQCKKCDICKRWVQKDTFHCLSCNRCTTKYDHHSQLINNCISNNDSGKYISMNLCFCFGTNIIMAQSLVLFIIYHSNSQLREVIINKWAIMAILIIAFINFMFALQSFIFSCYLRFCRKMTRFEYKFRQTDSNKSDSDEDIGDQKETQQR